MGDPLNLKNLLFRIAKAAVKWIYVGKFTGAKAMCVITFARRISLEKVSSIRNEMCALEVFKSLNGVSPHAFQIYFTKINHSQGTRANTKNIVLPKVKTEPGKKAFSFEGAKFLIN